MLEKKGSKIKEVKKELKEYEQSNQLNLFPSELFNGKKDEKYSNTVELYDVMPKYYFGGVEREAGKYLDILERNFFCGEKEYKLNISPAAILDKNGKTIHYYPSQREELVEDALRKLIIARQRGVYLDKDAAVKFTLYELQQELKRMGHGYDLNEIKLAIEVCNQSFLKITSKDGNEVSITSSIFPFVGMENSEKIEGGRNRVVVMFHPLVTKSINEGTYRLINYEKVMGYKMHLSRWLHKRISHYYTQLGKEKPFPIKLSTIIRDSGMKQYEKISHTILQIIKALEEMKLGNTLSKFEKELIYEKIKKNGEIRDGRKILDAKFLLYPSDSFISDVIKANKAANLQFLGEQQVEIIIDYELLRKKIEDPVYGLSKTIINNYLSKILDKEDEKTLINALVAAKEYIENIENKKGFSAVAITRKAIEEGWKPKNNIKKEGQIELLQTKKETIIIKNDDSFWRNLIKILKKDFEKEIFDRWLSRLNFINYKDGELILGVESKFLRDWIIREYTNLLLKSFQKIDNSISRLSINYYKELDLKS